MKTCTHCEEEVRSDALSCPFCGAKFDPPPFIELTVERAVPEGWLPTPLLEFYRFHEGCGLSMQGREVRIARLDELEKMTTKEFFRGSVSAPSWKRFQCIVFGAGGYGDTICYVLTSPVARPGSIMAFGMDVAGPGGIGEDKIEGSIVLADSFESWLSRLREDGWQEFGLTPGMIGSQSATRKNQLQQHFLALNPAIKWW